MKVVHLNKEKETGTGTDQAEEAALLEKSIREDPGNEKTLNRLMILYRKLKEPAKELKLINKAIKIFEEKFKKRQPVYNKKITAISKKILKATGLADKKGNNLYEPGDLTKWKKRKATLLKKVKA